MNRLTNTLLGRCGPWLLLAVGCGDPDLKLGASNTAGSGGISSGGEPSVGGAGSGSGGAAGSFGGASPKGTLALTVGSDHSCALRDGTVWCWGGSNRGQTGQGPDSTTGSLGSHDWSLAPVAGLTDIVELEANSGHTCARHRDGRVSCWGSNEVGQVGPESAPELTCFTVVLDVGPVDEPCQPTATLVPDVENAVELAIGPKSSCARLADGSVRCWGEMTAPTEWLAAQTGVDQIALGSVACVIRGGDLSCSDASSAVTGAVESVVSSGGSGLVCALHGAGRVTCWGPNVHGQRGIGRDATNDFPPPPAIDAGAVQVALGEAHACALREDGTVACWGRNYVGGLGIAPEATPECTENVHCLDRPRVVTGLPRALDLAVMGETSCIVSDVATLWCWGAVLQGGAVLWTGTPTYLPGPWEDGPASCGPVKRTIGQRMLEIATTDASPCQIARDCTVVPLDIDCSHGCDTGPISQATADRIRSELAELAEQACDAQCPAPAANCGPLSGELACDQGRCVAFDPVARGCADPCECRVRAASWNDTLGCSGTDLYFWGYVPCVGCGSSKVTLLIANRGRTRFQGAVAVEVLPTSESPNVLPRSTAAELTIDPGTLSKTVVLDVPVGSGSVTVRLVSTGDCDPSNDETVVLLPEVATCE